MIDSSKDKTKNHKLLTGFNVLIEKVNLRPQRVVQALEAVHSSLHDGLILKTLQRDG